MSNRNPGKGEGDIVNCERALGNLGDSARSPYASCSMKTIHYVPLGSPLGAHGGTLDRIALLTEQTGSSVVYPQPTRYPSDDTDPAGSARFLAVSFRTTPCDGTSGGSGRDTYSPTSRGLGSASPSWRSSCPAWPSSRRTVSHSRRKRQSL